MIETKEAAKRLGKVTGLDPEEIREQLRMRSRKSLYFLSKAILGYPDLTPTFHRQICQQIQNPQIKRKLLEVPRGHLKTTIATRSFPIWRFIQAPDPPHFWGPDERILLAMSSGPVASIQLQAVEHHFQNNQLFQWLFPELIPADFQKTIWNTEEMRIAGTSSSEPSLTIGGVGTKLTGRHFTGIDEDDLVDETICDSKLEIERRVSWHQYAFPLLEVPERDWIYTIGNRWGKVDVNGWIKENEPRCQVIHYRALLPDKTPLWPDRFSADTLSKLRITLGAYKFACQYMNDPKDPEAAAFSSSWIRYYEWATDPRGNKVLVTDTGEVIPRNELWVYMMVDPAASPGNRADRTGIVVTAIDKMGRIFILDAIAVRKDPYEALKDVYEVYNRHKPSQVGIEAVAFSRLLIHPLERMAAEKGQWLPILPIKGANTAGAKETRINQVVGETFASGRTFIRKEMTDFIDEYSWFPDPTVVRDLLDAYSLSDQMWIFSGKPRRGVLETAEEWLKAARAAGMSEICGY